MSTADGGSFVQVDDGNSSLPDDDDGLFYPLEERVEDYLKESFHAARPPC